MWHNKLLTLLRPWQHHNPSFSQQSILNHRAGTLTPQSYYPLHSQSSHKPSVDEVRHLVDLKHWCLSLALICLLGCCFAQGWQGTNEIPRAGPAAAPDVFLLVSLAGLGQATLHKGKMLGQVKVKICAWRMKGKDVSVRVVLSGMLSNCRSQLKEHNLLLHMKESLADMDDEWGTYASQKEKRLGKLNIYNKTTYRLLVNHKSYYFNI